MIEGHGAPTWTPGGSVGIVWSQGVALVSSQLGPQAAGKFWLRIREGVKFNDFLRHLAEASGTTLLDLPEFAVAIAEEDRWHLAVRGPMSLEAQFGSVSEAMPCRNVTTWTERTVIAPTALRLGEPVGGGAPVSDGVVLASSLEVGLFQPASTVMLDETIALPNLDEPESAAAPTVLPKAAPAEPEPVTLAEHEPVPADSETIAVEPQPQVTEASVEPVAPEPVDTTLPGGARKVTVGCLRLQDGDPIPLGGPVIFGRHPGTGGLNLNEPARLVTIRERHISANHIAVFREDGKVFAKDLGSRNGSAVRRQGGEPLRLPERPIVVHPGDVLDLGHGVLIHCERIP